MEKLTAAFLTGRTAVHRVTLVMNCPPKAFPTPSPFIRMTIHVRVYYVVFPTGYVYPMTAETSMWVFYVKSLSVFRYQTKHHEHIGVFIESLLKVPTALRTDPESAHIKKLLSIYPNHKLPHASKSHTRNF